MYRALFMGSIMQKKLQWTTHEQKDFDTVRSSLDRMQHLLVLVRDLRKDFLRWYTNGAEHLMTSNTFKGICDFRNVMHCWMTSMSVNSINLVNHFYSRYQRYVTRKVEFCRQRYVISLQQTQQQQASAVLAGT